ncbi:unnamed protein product [Rotaria sordida]|uniref:Vacuolar protein sorting-associated protein 13A n=1 Tax=Rotaria sordida TaxID=392033 RepID=A0A815AHS4_9BILA|nr:unnamed protein product [Rotaria sordida]
MVFEKFVVHLLDKYLSDYIENLDYKKLKVDIWSGNVILENLYLKPNALADLNLPITITIGYLKKLALQIPWKNLYTHPTKLTIDGLYVHVIPKIEIEYNAKQDEKEQHEAKMKEVNKIEKLRQDKEAFKDINNIEKDNDTFSARMKLQIMQNLELLIHNIHIVYEDKTTKPNHPFAFGITLNYITFQTTNKEWIPTIIKENSPVIYKLGELNALSIYWNTNIKSNSNLPRNEIIKNLQTKIAVDTDQVSKDMTYIFRPFNVKTKLIMTMKPRQQKFERPMFYITIDLGHISLNLNRAQYLDILDLLEFQGHITAKLKYIKYRPQKFDKTIEKWIFAYNAIVNEKIKPRLECYKWENIKKHLEYCREYRYIYVQELTGKITDEQKQRTEELEKKLDVFNLTYIRQRAQLEARKKKEQKPKTLLENFSNWWNNKSSQTDPELDLEKILSAEEKEKLYETIGYEGEDTSTLTYPKDYVDIDLSIRLIMLDLNIWSKINENDQQFRVISRAALPDTEIIFKRRPTTSSALFLVSLGSFQVFGIATDLKQSELSNDNRPVLIHPIIQSTLSNNQLEQPKLLEVEFETNPLDRDSGYRIKVISQSVEVKYNAPTINKLIECFEQDTQRNLQGVKQAAYTTYTDVKHRSILLMKYNIETTKVLDIHINLQSPFFILPENGVYYDGCPAICLDMGNLILQQNSMINKNDEETMDNYIQFQLELKNFQLLYANKYENWQNARQQETTRLHLIKPITLSINLFKCLYSDNANFPAWKISGQIPLVSVRISDMRLFKIIKHIQSLPFPQSKYRTITDIENETELWMTPTLIDTTQQTLETIENMTPMKKILEKLANENQKIENKFEEQFTQIEANFKLSQIDLLLEEEKEDRDYPFLRISFISIYVQTFIKTFDIEFQASLDDFIIYHEQFITKDNQHLRFLAAQHEENQNIDKINSKKLVSLHILHTSSNNPLFTSSKYDGLENKIRIHFSKLIVTLQLEALLSIMKFQDNFMQKWPTDIFEEHIEKKQLSEKFSQENKRMSTIEKFVKTNNLSLESTLEIEANLEEFHIVIATMDTQMFDVYIHGVKANMHNTSNETFLNLILTDFCMFDPHMDARFRKIISQQSEDNELLSVSMVLFNYPKIHTKALDDVDCSVKINFAKAKILFLYKYVDQIMGFLDILNISKSAIDVAQNQIDAVYEQVQNIQNQAYKLHLNATFNAPNIIIPINAYSDEALCLDLGKLILQTKFIDDPEIILIEQQQVNIENVRARRVKLNKNNNEIENEIILLECANLKIDINRLLYPEKIKFTAYISVNMQWDLIHFQLAKDDYLCVMKILMENFNDQTITNIIREQYRYQQEQQKQEEDALRNAVIKKQTAWQIGEIFEKIKVHAEIKKLALTLYLGESNLINRHVKHEENLKLVKVEINIFEVIYRQHSDSSYKVIARVKNFLFDDLRETHKTDTVTHMMDRHFTVDPNAYMLIASLEFKSKDSIRLNDQQRLNIQLESLYICIKLDYLIILKDFFMSNIPIDDKNKSKNQEIIMTTSTLSSIETTNNNVETRIDILVKNPEIILLEDQHNSNSNCLVLNFALDIRALNIGDNTNLFGALNDLTIYSSKFAELKSSKVKYRILQPTKVDLSIIIDLEQQKIDIRFSHIIINITPAAARILIGVTSSLSKHEPTNKQEKFDMQTMFKPKPINESDFWYLQDINDLPSQKNSLIENKKKKEESCLSQQLVLTLTTMEIKLDVGFGLVTKPVVAMCLSNWTVDLKNWSDQMTASLTMNIEAALYNEHTLAWEPLIEPTLDKNTGHLSPWNITCSITPIYPISDRLESSSTHTQQQQKKISGLNAKQLISIGTQQLLNITITKTGLELIQNLSSLFNDIYNQRLPKNFNENESLLSLVNLTGQDIFIDNLNGLEFTDDITWTSKVMKQNESISLNAPVERLSSTYRLSVMEEQTFKKRQEFSVQFDDHIKLININRTWQRIYDLKPSFIPFFPIQLLCDTQIHNNCRRIILSSIIKIYNNTTLPIAILDFNSNTEKSYHRIGINEYYYVPINLFYKSSNLSISIGVDENDPDGSISDFFEYHWITTMTLEKKLQLKNGKANHLIVYREIKEAYLENTDQLERNSYSIYIHSTIHLTNLLPIDIQCSINNIEEIYLKPSQLQLITSGGKNSILRFIIPFYNKIKWISDPIDLGIRKRNDPSEQIITFHNATSTDKQQILRMALRVDLFHESYRLSLYAPFWIVNHTNLKLEFQIGNDRILIKNIENSFLVCPEKYTNDTSEKGQIRLYGVTQNDSMKYWSEEFSLHVIKSIGMANCKGPNDKTYMICVDITTSSFGLTKIVTLSPAMVIINQTSIPIEIVETLRDKEQSQWIFVECDEVIPFWPQNAKEGLMRVRYAHNQKTSKAFSMNKKHHTLLYMNDTERLVIFVEVIATDFDGVRVIFSDYKQVDAPVLLINHTDDQLISFVQKDDMKIQYLVPQYFVYYTWMDPLKPREMIITCNDKSKTIELNPHRGDLDINENYHTVKYIVFIDGVQTVLLFSCDEQIIEATLNIPSSTQSICRRLQLGMPNVGLSIVNDIRREELLYMSLKKSKLIWVQIKKSGMKPFSHDIHTQLEELYRINLQLIETNPNDETLRQTKYHMGDYREVTFYENTAKLVNQKGEHKLAKRQSLNGLWIEYTWSMTNAAFYACINHIQIDNQLEYTNFPSILYPILSKTADSDITEKPFIELSIYESKASQSNIMHFQYCKLLIQEFVLQIDQGLILAILAFLRQEKNTTTPMINMDTDLEYTHNSLRAIIKVQTDTPAGETQMYFDNIHLSPLKIHVSFSMHGLKSNDELFAEYPLVRFLLRTLNVGEVKNVILRLGFYERSFDRFTVTKLTNEVSAHYQNQFFKQIHVLILGLDVLGNPLGIIRGIAEGVESLFYEPYKGAIEGPLEFAEGMATGVLTLVGSTAGTAAGAASRITGVIGQSLAKLTFDEEYKASRIRRREPAAHAITDIAAGGKNVVMGFVNGVTGVVKKPVAGAARSGASGFVKGLGKGLIGLVAQPASGIVDFASTSLDVVKRAATQEQIVRRVRYPRHVGRDGLVRPYIPHEAMGLYILNRLEDRRYAKTDTYVAHITCSESPMSWLMATSKRILFVTEISILGTYEVDWTISYVELYEIPTIIRDKNKIQILVKPQNTGGSDGNRPSGKLVKYRNIDEARYFVDKTTNAMHSIGL